MAGISPIMSAATAWWTITNFIASIEAPVVIDHMARIDIDEGLERAGVTAGCCGCSTAVMSG